jgi:UDP-N-acetylmuramyl pentapeptide phosphotransferase/UDP-N-acetylglucosamine-1-phosphate transferase
MRDRIPTRQGAGVAVIATTLISAAAVIALAGAAQTTIPIAAFGATLFIATVCFADDVKSIPVVARLLLQGIAVAAVMLAAPESLRIVPACPLCVERGLLLLTGLGFVNLVNFMDGLDLLTTAEIVPITGALILLGWLVELPASGHCSGRCSASRPSKFFSATSAAYRSACSLAGAWCNSPGIST